MNVNRAMKAPMRSAGARQVIDRYGELGEPIPKNGSNDALSCDHVHAVTAEDLRALVTLEDWIASLADEYSPPVPRPPQTRGKGFLPDEAVIGAAGPSS